MNLKLVGMSLTAATVLLAYPQSTNVTTPKFEVASIKANTTGGSGTRVFPSGNRFSVENAPFTLLIRLAYDIKDFQISGVHRGHGPIGMT